MSCWVVPSVAAELWGVSVEHVLKCIREGTIVSRTDNGFLCVDAMPDSAGLSSMKREDRPPTFTVVTQDEIAALLGSNGDDSFSDDSENSDESNEDDAEETGTLDWREARRRNASLRRAPVLLN